MAPNTNWDELLSSTLKYHSAEISDNISKSIALLTRLEEKGNVKEYYGGGISIVENLEYAENGSFKYFTGYEKFNIAQNEVFSAAEYAIKQAVAVVMISGLEKIQNSGKHQIFDLMKARVENAKRTCRNTVGVDVYSDGTGTGGKQITGLQAYVSATPSVGTVGGIDRSVAANAFWRNQVYNALTDGGVTKSASNITTYLNRLSLACTLGNDRPDLGVMDNADYELLMSAMQARQIVSDSKLADLGFDAVKYRGIDFVCDGGIGGGCPASTTYLLNTQYLKWRPIQGQNFQVDSSERVPVDQQATLKVIFFAGNLTGTNWRQSGVLTNS